MSYNLVHDIRFWSILRSRMVTNILCTEENSMCEGVKEFSLSQDAMSSLDSEFRLFL